MQADYTDRYVAVDGLDIRYWDEGAGEPLILIHGLAASLETWHLNVGELARQRRVIALDLPGFGGSSRSARRETYSAGYADRFMRLFVGKLGLRRVSVAGNSMGGMVALRFALSHPQMVDRLILVASAGLGREINWPNRLLSVWPLGELLFHPSRPLVELAVSSVIRRGEIDEEFVRRTREYLAVPGTKEAILHCLRSGVNLRGQFAVADRHELGRIEAPTLIVWGACDPVFPPAHAQAAAQAIPDARLVILEDAGHAPHMDCPREFNECVLRFLGQAHAAAAAPRDRRRECPWL